MNKDNKINSFARVLGYFIVTPIIFIIAMTVILNIFKTKIFTENVLYVFASIGFVLGLVNNEVISHTGNRSGETGEKLH